METKPLSMIQKERKHYIDNIRWGVVLLVIFYHAIYIYNSVGVITNIKVEGIPLMDIPLYFIYPWFMALMFLIAGMSARYALEKKGCKTFFKERVRKLFIPSTVGVLLIGWISGWVTCQYTDMFAGNGDLIPGIIKYFMYALCGIGPLWFMQELFVGTLVLLLIRWIDQKNKLGELGKKVNKGTIILLLFVVWGSSNVLNTPVIEVYRNGFYWFMFLLGYYVFSHDEVMNQVEQMKLPMLVIAIVTGIVYTIYYYGENYTTQKVLNGFFTNFYVWVAILAVLGCAKSWANKENKFTKYMKSRSFGFYILHYPLLVLIAYLLDQYVHLPKIGNYIVVFVLEVICLPLVYEIVSRIPLVKNILFGYRRVKKDKHLEAVEVSK